MITTDLAPSLATLQQRIESKLDALFSTPSHSERLLAAMRYSTLNGGKRIRALLVYAVGLSIGADLDMLDRPAMAIELIHAFSLIHDDLPAMDNDDLRRGKPTCHIAFDEATAILAGDALQTLAFEILSEPHADLSPKAQCAMIHTLTRATGYRGMAGGQCIDIESCGKKLDLPTLKTMHHLKTGRLIEASVQLGYLASGLQKGPTQDELDAFARLFGLAYQIQDDILDVTQETQTLGKTAQKDLIQNKPTYPSIMGIEASQTYLKETTDKALHILNNTFSGPNILFELLGKVQFRTF